MRHYTLRSGKLRQIEGAFEMIKNPNIDAVAEQKHETTENLPQAFLTRLRRRG
jgi:hypothetical protein